MKYFVISDCHGFYSKLMEKLKEVGFDENNPEHMLISLGDMFDRGNEPLQILEFYKRMVKNNKMLMVRGNHEDLFYSVLENKRFFTHDYHNKTYETFEEFCKYFYPSKGIRAFYEDYDELLDKFNEIGLFQLIDSMNDYIEIGNYIFVHGYIPLINEKYFDPNWRNSDNWFDAEWTNGMKASEELGAYEEGKTVVCGHYLSAYGNVRKILKLTNPKKFARMSERELSMMEEDYLFSKEDKKLIGVNSIYDIFYGEHVIAIDACTAYSEQINVFIFESNEEVKTSNKKRKSMYDKLKGNE